MTLKTVLINLKSALDQEKSWCCGQLDTTEKPHACRLSDRTNTSKSNSQPSKIKRGKYLLPKSSHAWLQNPIVKMAEYSNILLPEILKDPEKKKGGKLNVL